jgi:prophage regulatory protein
VIQATGLGRATIYRLFAKGDFPRPVHLGPRAIAWRWSGLEP